ncbi:MAG: S1-like domain-containing RNA-binding protein [Atopostipes suicloacalis]|nr:S1-like domain-containing RNA-binding protein [Atopostipes suicloacalis]
MENILAYIITAMVIDKNEKNVFVQKDGTTIKVVDIDPEKYEVGDMVEGFVYIDKDDNYLMMTEIPKVHLNEYGWGEVVEVSRELGVFVDVAWENKDLLVSLDDLPILKNVWPRKGDQLYLTVAVDNKDRMWGQLVGYNDMLASAKPASGEMHNDDVKGIVVNSLKAGSYIELEGGYLGFVHPSERDREPRLGETVEARVIGVREDAVLYLSLMPRAHEVLDEDASMLFEVMKRAEGYRIPYNDKSKPEAIREYFAISKGQFKRAIGRLMKENLVKQDKEGSYLTEKGIKES